MALPSFSPRAEDLFQFREGRDIFIAIPSHLIDVMDRPELFVFSSYTLYDNRRNRRTFGLLDMANLSLLLLLVIYRFAI